jgi:hypothetical protein
MVVNWTNVTTPEQMLAIPNSTTNGAFWLTVTFLIWVVLNIVFQSFGFEVALLASSFIALVIALFLSYMGLVAFGWVLFFLGILLFTIIYIIWSSNRDQ